MPWRSHLDVEVACPSCGRAGGLRPHVVWFGEMPLGMDTISEALHRADLFVSIGTSGAVYPAAGFVSEARLAGLRTCEINLEPSENARQFDETHYGPASETVPRWVERILVQS
jgi:NAD-dependent deacetylase